MNRIKEHYIEQAKIWGDSKQSTMPDIFVRDKEIEKIIATLDILTKNNSQKMKILEIGCGNGYTAEQVSKKLGLKLTGIDFCEDLISISRKRDITDVKFLIDDVLQLHFDSDSFNIIFTERCLINLETWELQMQGIKEIHRILKPGGFFIMLEAFKEGLANLNSAREVIGLTKIEEPFHNIYFNKKKLSDFMRLYFIRVKDSKNNQALDQDENFLSSYYFGSRVLYPALIEAKREIIYNSKFAEFFTFMPPYGEYSYVQMQVYQKINDINE
jgi:ubiquinone/menaquinone biosynthesis C-methylase UbiE